MRKKGKKVIRPAGDERFKYHANMLDVCNVLNQIGILKDEKAESVMKNHTMQCFDCLERLGYPIEKFLKEQEKES